MAIAISVLIKRVEDTVSPIQLRSGPREVVDVGEKEVQVAVVHYVMTAY